MKTSVSLFAILSVLTPLALIPFCSTPLDNQLAWSECCDTASHDDYHFDQNIHPWPIAPTKSEWRLMLDNLRPDENVWIEATYPKSGSVVWEVRKYGNNGYTVLSVQQPIQLIAKL